MMFRKITEILTEFFDRKRDVWLNVNYCVHDIFDCMLIIFLIDAFIVWFSQSKYFVFIHWKFCNFVFVSVHVESWKNVNEIIRLIYAKNSIWSIAIYFNVKNFIHFFQIFDFKCFFDFFFWINSFVSLISLQYSPHLHISIIWCFFWNDAKSMNQRKFARNLI